METSTIFWIIFGVVAFVIVVGWPSLMHFVFYNKLENACLIYYEESSDNVSVKKYFGPTVNDKGEKVSALTRAYNAKNKTQDGPNFVFKWLWPFGGFSRVETDEEAKKQDAAKEIPANHYFDPKSYTCPENPANPTGETYVNYSELNEEKKKPADRLSFETAE